MRVYPHIAGYSRTALIRVRDVLNCSIDGLIKLSRVYVFRNLTFHQSKSLGQALIGNVARNSEAIQQTRLYPPDLSSDHYSTSSNQNSTSFQAVLVDEEDQQDEDSDQQSLHHPLSHLGAGRFWSPTKEPNSWMHRVWQLKRKRHAWADVKSRASEVPRRDLLAESAAWLDKEYPISPEHISFISEPQIKTEISTSHSSFRCSRNESLQQQPQKPARSEAHHSMTLFSHEVKTWRQPEVIHQEIESEWIPSCRLTEVDTTSLGLTELEWANVQELPFSDVQAPGHCFNQPDKLKEVRKPKRLSPINTPYSTASRFAPAPLGEGQSNPKLTRLYDPPDISGAIEVEDPLAEHTIS